MKDPRIEQTRKIVESIISKTLLYNTQVMITNDNLIVCVVDNTILYIIELKNIVEPYPSIAFMYGDIIDLEVDEYIPNIHLLHSLSSLFTTYITQKSQNPIVASNGELRGNEQFEQLLAMKAAEGMKYFNLIGKNNTNYKIPIFSGFPNLSKQDLIGINVYDQLDGHLIIEMNIFKKKINRNIDMYFRTLKI